MQHERFQNDNASLNPCTRSQNSIENERTELTVERPVIQCTFCPKTFRFNSMYQRHRLKHTGEKPEKCSHCAKRFGRRSTRLQHERSHFTDAWHENASLNPCSRSPNSFENECTESNVRRPVVIQCTFCPQTFRFNSMYQRHRFKHTGEKPEKCSHCTKRFARRSTRLQHERSYFTKKSYTCPVCAMHFSARLTYVNHARTHSECSYRCRYCWRRFNIQINCHEHEKNCRLNKETRIFASQPISRPVVAQNGIKNELSRQTSDDDSSLNDDNYTFEMFLDNFCKFDTDNSECSSQLQSNGIPNSIHMREEEINLNEFHGPDDKTHCTDVNAGNDTIDPLSTPLDSVIKVETHSDLETSEIICAEQHWEKTKFPENVATEKRFKCRYCNRHFVEEDQLERHERIHTNVRNVENNSSSLHASIAVGKSIHQNPILNNTQSERIDCSAENETQKIRYECIYCDRYFPTSRKCKRHERWHTGDRPYKCRFCEKCFFESAHCRVHEQVHSNQSNYQCPYCMALFKEYSNCIRHKKVRCKLRPIDAKDVKRVIDLRKNPLEQENRPITTTVTSTATDGHAPDNQNVNVIQHFDCVHCGKRFDTKASCQRHQRIHLDAKYQCRFCEKTFVEAGNCRIHEQGMHSDESLFQCPYCAKLFKRQSSCNKHSKRYCRLRATKPEHMKKVIDLRKTADPFDSPPFRCEHCHRDFSLKLTLERHLQTHTDRGAVAATSDNYNETVCQDVSMVAGDSLKMELDIEETLATNEHSNRFLYITTDNEKGRKMVDNVFTCEYCNREFDVEDDCKQHEKEHTAPKNLYKCRFCEKCFSVLANYRIHEQKHSKEKIFKCPICMKLFNNLGSCVRHKNAHRYNKPNQNSTTVKVNQRKPSSMANSIGIETSESKGDELKNGMGVTIGELNEQNQTANVMDENSNSKIDVKPGKNEVEPFKCAYCSRTFNRKTDCKQHEQDVHLDNPKPHKCSYCERTFNFMWNCRAHELTHSCRYYFQCPYCEKMFRSHSSGIKHTKGRCPDRPTDPKLIKRCIDLRK